MNRKMYHHCNNPIDFAQVLVSFASFFQCEEATTAAAADNPLNPIDAFAEREEKAGDEAASAGDPS